MAKEFKPMAVTEGLEKMLAEKETNPDYDPLQKPKKKNIKTKIDLGLEIPDTDKTQFKSKTFYLSISSLNAIERLANMYGITESKFLDIFIAKGIVEEEIED